MSEKISRRTFVRGIGAATVGAAAAAAGSGSVSARNGDGQVLSVGPSGVGDVAFDARTYGEYTKGGALVENVDALSGVEMLPDVHFLIWSRDWESIHSLRDHSGSSSLERTDEIPEVTIQNAVPTELPRNIPPEYGYDSEFTQRVLACRDRQAVLFDTDLGFDLDYFVREYDQDYEHTIYTVLNPEIGGTGPGHEGYTKTVGGYDVVVATDGSNYLAVTQSTAMDGQRIGRVGGKTAWADIDVEEDGWIDSNEYNSGDIDVGFGNYIGTDNTATWQTAIGFGQDESTAVDSAVGAVDARYETARSKW